jgi:hypothetical protein
MVVMRNNVKISAMFVVGLLIGALVTFTIIGKANQRLWARCVATGVMEQAFIATELRNRRQDDLQRRAEANLPPAVLAIHEHKELQSVPESQTALRAVKDFYDMNSVPVPSEIATILNDVAPAR